MKQFNDDNFLLQTETAQRLYHDHAAKMPIIDYHCHLIPEYVASDHRFDNLSKIWLEGDHYKWRAMRTNGVDEKYCTGKDTTDWEKFEKWAETVPYTMRNPLYHWTHLELKTAFGVTKLLNPASAREIYDHCTALLQRPEYHARGLMRRYNVEADGRSRGFARTPHQGPRGRFCDQDAPHVASRQGDGRGGSGRFPRLYGEAFGGFGRRDHEVRRCDRRAARASRVLRVGRLPSFGPRHRGVLCRGLYAGRDRRYF